VVLNAALGFVQEGKAEGALRREPPREPGTRIINTLFMQRIAVIGLAIALPGFLLYYNLGAAASRDRARTVAAPISLLECTDNA